MIEELAREEGYTAVEVNSEHDYLENLTAKVGGGDDIGGEGGGIVEKKSVVRTTSGGGTPSCGVPGERVQTA